MMNIVRIRMEVNFDEWVHKMDRGGLTIEGMKRHVPKFRLETI